MTARMTNPFDAYAIARAREVLGSTTAAAEQTYILTGMTYADRRRCRALVAGCPDSQEGARLWAHTVLSIYGESA